MLLQCVQKQEDVWKQEDVEIYSTRITSERHKASEKGILKVLPNTLSNSFFIFRSVESTRIVSSKIQELFCIASPYYD